MFTSPAQNPCLHFDENDYITLPGLDVSSFTGFTAEVCACLENYDPIGLLTFL
ncbi:MAG: hypothetical protein K8R53_04500 [Bacteroidales bacterium]|nr:hypothetical protein [Bacteroidales bacterium]